LRRCGVDPQDTRWADVFSVLAEAALLGLVGSTLGLAAVKYRFIVAIEVCIDLGRHIIASDGLRAPLD